MERVEYLPLGSVVLLKESVQKVTIISRAMLVAQGDKQYFFDYGGVLYPDGLVGEDVAYFNNANISKVVFEGYSDIDDENFVDNVNRYLETNNVERISIDEQIEE